MAKGKTITFGIPCYNSAEYMDHCITSILEGSDYADDVQIVVVDDGSTKDNTYEKALEWQNRHPSIIKAVHQENGGHGMAVLAALENAEGLYFKIVDSDDWLDEDALSKLLSTLRDFEWRDMRVDLVITNYVYEHVEDNTHNVVDFRYALKRGKVITWDKIGHFNMAQNLLMPLPRCKTLYYLDVDLYRYFIGRDDQSVNEKVMISRIDQQLRITRIMMDAYHLYDEVESTKLRNYMIGYFTLMMAVCSIFSRLSDAPDAMENCDKLWVHLKHYDKRMYRRARMGVVGIATNLPTKAGEKFTLGIYRIASKLMKFN